MAIRRPTWKDGFVLLVVVTLCFYSAWRWTGSDSDLLVHQKSTSNNTGERSTRLGPQLLPRIRENHYNSNETMDVILNNRCFPEELSSGPIRRTKHTVKATEGKSRFTAIGDGLSHATVGQSAHIVIKLNSTVQGKLLKGPFFSILAVSERHIFAIYPTATSGVLPYVNFTYKPTLPGKYMLFVEEISGKGQRQVPGSPFNLIIDGPTVDEESRRTAADALPSCQTLPLTDLSWVNGEWVTRDLAGVHRGTLRSGWVLQPKMCSFDIFTADDLELASFSPEPLTIIVLGRSTERGIFLSMVDIALRKSEKLDMDKSVIWKCWGFCEVQIGSLRLIYQDFRIEGATMEKIKDDEHVNITCHNEKKVSSNNDFFGDAIGYFEEFLFNDRLWPDVMILVVKNRLQLRLLMQAIPDSWNGTAFPLSGFKCHEGSLFTATGRQANIEEAKCFPSLDSRIRLLDGFAIASPLRHTTERAPFIMTTQHWHKACNESDGNIRVCSDATEMVAQLLLGQAIAPNGKKAWLASIDPCKLREQMRKPREIQVCHDSPKSYLPWHVKRVPDPKCYKTTNGLRFHDVKDITAWDGSLCPADCMKTSPVGKSKTQSGDVDVRICTILKPRRSG